jgi:hypothetical protein
MIDGASSTCDFRLELVRRPGAAKPVGPLVELYLVPDLGEPCGCGQASKAATNDDNGIGHQPASQGCSSMRGA